MIVLGITGAIASGKSTVAAMFADSGVPVFSADAAVHQLYDDEPGPVIDAFPAAASGGAVDRRRLSDIIETDPEAIGRLEAIIHPKVQEAAREFVASAKDDGAPVAVLEIPLLLEAGSDVLCDKILVTTAPEPVRDARVAARGTMSPALYRRLLDRQIPEKEKLGRADYVVDTDVDLGDLQGRIGDIIAELQAESRG